MLDDVTARNQHETDDLTTNSNSNGSGSVATEAPPEHHGEEHASTPAQIAASHEAPAAGQSGQSSQSSSHGSSQAASQANMDDFASALESFEAESAEAEPSDDNVVRGTVVNVTATHVVVDIGAKSEGMVPIAEVRDHDGNVPFKSGDEIPVTIVRGETEEGYTKLSYER
ncbi:MAG TPA: S1 RNA-binding domain-containing protein, partial [Terriglobales bacterium]|nr:S1 RNA-binding domain-containing protein [Terriglobales bacterium]